MALYKNLTGEVSKIGYVCKQAPNDPTAFIYASANETNILGIVTKSVPKNALCEIATNGTTKVFVAERVSQGSIVRAQRGADRISRGTCKAAKSTDTPYLKIGTALDSGKGLINVSLNIAYVLSTNSDLEFLKLDQTTQQTTVGTLHYPTATFGGSANYTQVEADGTVKFNGDATVWDDLNFDPDSSGGPAVSLPDYVTINNVIHREFTSANNQICGDGEELPHCYKLSSTIYPHIHVFLKASEATGTTGAAFTFYWELRQETGTTSGSVVLTATSAALSGNPHKVDVFDNTGFAGAAELGAQLTVTIARTAGNAGDVIVTTYGVHYEKDTVGSRQITTK